MALTWTCAAFGTVHRHRRRPAAAKVKIAKNRVREIQHAFLEYQIDNGRCPATIDVLVADRYLTKQGLVDPWGTRFAYWCYGGRGGSFGRRPTSSSTPPTTSRTSDDQGASSTSDGLRDRQRRRDPRPRTAVRDPAVLSSGAEAGRPRTRPGDPTAPWCAIDSSATGVPRHGTSSSRVASGPSRSPTPGGRASPPGARRPRECCPPPPIGFLQHLRRYRQRAVACSFGTVPNQDGTLLAPTFARGRS